MSAVKITLEPGQIKDNEPFTRNLEGHFEQVSALSDKGPLPYHETKFEKAIKYLNPFLKYVFSLKPAIPNLIYMTISIIAMQVLNIKDLMPKDVDWLQTALFWGLFASIGIQILFASAKSISIPILTILAAAGAVWLQTHQGVTLPIAKEIFQYLICLGIFGVVVSSVFNH